MMVKILVVIALVFNAVVFLLPLPRTEIFWVSYGFFMAAVVVQLGILIFLWGRVKNYADRFLSIPLIKTGVLYLVLHLISFVCFVAFYPETSPLYIPILVNVVLLAIFLVRFIAVDASRQEIARIDKKLQSKVSYIKELQIDVEMVMQRVDDGEAKKKLKKLSEMIKYSNPMSNESLSLIESKIATKSAELSALANGNQIDKLEELCEGIEQLLDERNRKCKLLKA